MTRPDTEQILCFQLDTAMVQASHLRAQRDILLAVCKAALECLEATQPVSGSRPELACQALRAAIDRAAETLP